MPQTELLEHLSPRRLTYSEAEVAGLASGGGAGDAPPIGEGAGDVQGEIRSFLVARAPESVLPKHLSPRRLTYSEAEVAGLASGGGDGDAPIGEGDQGAPLGGEGAGNVLSDQGERSFLVARMPQTELPEHLTPRRLTYSEAEVAGLASGGGAGDAPIGEGDEGDEGDEGAPLGGEGAGDIPSDRGRERSFLVAIVPNMERPEYLSPRRLTYSEAKVAGLHSGGGCLLW